MSDNYIKIKFLYQTLKLSPKQIASKLNLPISTVYKCIDKVNIVNYGKTTETMVYKSEKYQEWRSLVLARDNHKCVHCGNSGSKHNPLQVDHIKPRSVHPDLAYTVSNGRTLCRKCHRKTDTFGKYKIKNYVKNLKKNN